MLLVEPTNWDDVTEPTVEELAEIDAAVEAAETPRLVEAPASAWWRSYPVKRAVEEVGLPDGTAEWFVDFTAHLLAYTDKVGELRVEHNFDLMIALATTFQNKLGRQHWTSRNDQGGGHNFPIRPLRRMIELFPPDVVANYLDETVDQVERWLWPNVDLDSLRLAGRLVKEGTPQRKACERAGIGLNGVVLAAYLKAWRIEAIVDYKPEPGGRHGGARRRMPQSIRNRIVELGMGGLGAKAVQDAVNAEFGCGVTYSAVKMLLHRRKAAAA